jgi:hypothetical protein
MAQAPAMPKVAKVFISCPGDLAAERGVVNQALDALNHDPEFAGRVELVSYAYENIVPARSGMGAQDVVNSYMLRPEDAHLLICLLWRRMGTPLAHVINPTTNAPYQSGTEYEYLTAYAATQTKPTPLLLLYRCQRDAPEPATEEGQQQRARVNAFFQRFEAGGDLRGLVGHFTDEDDLQATIQRDVASVLRRDLLPLLELHHGPRADQPVVFGLPPLPAGFVPRPESLEQLRKALLGSRTQVGVVAATALHGLGGLGKTTLARAAWEDPAIRTAFADGALWATVGRTPDIARIQREWVVALQGDVFKVISDEAGKAELARRIGDRSMLLILDDVWQASAVEALAVAGPNCRVLLTTRDVGQVQGATPVRLDVMTPAQCRRTLRETVAAQLSMTRRSTRSRSASAICRWRCARSADCWRTTSAGLRSHVSWTAATLRMSAPSSPRR